MRPYSPRQDLRRGWEWLFAVIFALGMDVHATDRVVTNVFDAGPGSLRAAVTASLNGDSIQFDSTLSGQTITLFNGPMILDVRLAIDASTLPDGLTISGGGTTRIFQITTSGSISLRSLTLCGGRAPDGGSDPLGNGNRGGDGGAIHNSGELALSGCSLFDNAAGNGGGNGLARAGGGGSGGAIFNGRSLAMSNCTVGGNSAGSRGAGSTGFEGFGSAIYNAGAASVSACTIAGNGTLDSAPAWVGRDARQGGVPPSSASAPPVPAHAQLPTVFLSPTGSDTSAGTRAAPLLTAGAALAAIAGEGQIVLLAGDYRNLKFDLATAGRLTIRADHGAVVRVFLGEKVTAFTPESGIIWKATVAGEYDFTEMDNAFWIFEWGTPEGPVAPAAAQPLQRGRTHRLSSARLVRQASKAAVGTGAGRYWYDSTAHTLYVSATDGGNPNGRDYWIPSQVALQSMVFGGTASADVAVEGVQVFFGRENLDLSFCRSYIVRSCLLFGASDEGIAANSFGRGLEEDNEYAANANDGSGPSTYDPQWSELIVVDAWAHDNGDEGHSIHGNIEASYFGGLFEYNKNGGITPAMGAKFTAFGPYTRANAIGVCPAVTILNAPVDIISISATNPAVVTTAGPHGLLDGEMVRIADVIGNSPDINGDREAAVLGADTFTLPLAQTVVSNGGTVASFIGTSGTVCDWVSDSDFTAGYNPTVSGILKLLRPTVISPVLWAFNAGIGSTIHAYDPSLVSVANATAGAGAVQIIHGAPIPVPVSESGTAVFSAGRIEVGNSIVAGNAARNIGRWGSVTDFGYNLTAGDPRLSPFGDFGGPTPTMALLPDSPARNAALTAATSTDQRGSPRRVGAPDIGAYEAGTQATFHDWSVENFSGSGNHQFSDDVNNNGLLDGLEYALHGDFSGSPCGLKVCAATVFGQHSNAISFSYQATATDLIYIVERTTDLAPPVFWQTRLYLNLSSGSKTEAGGVTSLFDPVTGSATVFEPAASPPASLNSAPLKAFWRLRVEYSGTTY